MNGREAIISFLRESDGFLIATHINPDGDALGSSIALHSALESLGKRSTLYCRDEVPEHYEFLPGSGLFTNSLKGLPLNEMALILVDVNDTERSALPDESYANAAVIDHHETERGFGSVKWIDASQAATGMMIYEIVKSLGVKVTPDMATNLYAAISVDTGTFRYGNTTPHVLRVAAELIELGARPADIADNLYETWAENRMKLLSLAMATVEKKDGAALIVITKDMFGATGTSPDDTEDFVNYPRMMRGVKVAVLLREIGQDYWKISMRSKGQLSVREVAESFGGGGHMNAAGCRVKGTLDAAKATILDALLKKLGPLS